MVNSCAPEDEKKLEYTKEVVKRTDITMLTRKKKGQKTMIHLTLLRKLKIDQQELHYKPRLNQSVPEGKAIPILLAAPIV